MRKPNIRILAASADHPNKAPFEGVLTYFDYVSDRPVGGAKGRKVIIPSSVGVPALETLVGMAINAKANLSGHAPTTKIGVIEKAWAGDAVDDGSVPVYVSGYLYASDFADLVDDLREQQDDLGFSYETTDTSVVELLDAPEPTWKVASLVFTGAAVLYKDKAAYKNTSLAAEGEQMNEEQMKAMMDRLNAFERMLEEWASFKAAFEGDGKYASLSVYLSAAAEQAKKVADLETALSASNAKIVELEGALQASNEKLAQVEVLSASIDEVKTSVAPLVQHTETLRAEAEAKIEWQRRSAATPLTLMAKYGVDENVDLKAQIDAIDKMAIDDPVQRMALKMAAQDAWTKKQTA